MIEVEIKKACFILACEHKDVQFRNALIVSMCKTYSTQLREKGVEVELIDLYDNNGNEVEFTKDQILDYQSMIRNADSIFVFHNLIWSLPPGILKSFIDKVFISGFAYRYYKGVFYGLLKEKKFYIYCTTDLALWQEKYIYGNLIGLFWQRVFGDKVGIKPKIKIFDNIRSRTDEEIAKWDSTLLNDLKLNSKSTNLLDLF